jgi:NAD(P)H-flavin reductase
MTIPGSNHPYLPKAARIQEVIVENSQIKTFVLTLAEPEENRNFTYAPGQFLMLSVPHCGEAPISMASSPAEPGTIHLAIRRAGKLTETMHRLEPGAMVGLRGPYGRPFPMQDLTGRKLLFVAGGIGLAPLRSVIKTCLISPDCRPDGITLLYGSRSPADIAFRRDLEAWQSSGNISCHLTVDQGGPGWEGPVGLVTGLFDQVSLNPERHTALVCGPPLMIRAVLSELSQRGLPPERIITTLERHMKCGVGVCRHCHLDSKLVCKDGPVFTLAELRELSVMELT